MDLKLPKMIAGDYEPHFSLKHMFKDVQLGIHMANALDIEIPATTVTAGVMYGALNRGWGDLDFSALYKIYEPQAAGADLGGLQSGFAQIEDLDRSRPLSETRAPRPSGPSPSRSGARGDAGSRSRMRFRRRQSDDSGRKCLDRPGPRRAGGPPSRRAARSASSRRRSRIHPRQTRGSFPARSLAATILLARSIRRPGSLPAPSARERRTSPKPQSRRSSRSRRNRRACGETQPRATANAEAAAPSHGEDRRARPRTGRTVICETQERGGEPATSSSAGSCSRNGKLSGGASGLAAKFDRTHERRGGRYRRFETHGGVADLSDRA